MTDNYSYRKKNELELDRDSYVKIGDIIDRFIEIDNHYNHEPWNLTQIFSNIEILDFYTPDKLNVIFN